MKFKISTPTEFIQFDSALDFKGALLFHIMGNTLPDEILIDTADAFEPRIDFIANGRRLSRFEGECATKVRYDLYRIDPRILPDKQ